MSQSPSFSYDPAWPVRDPRTKGLAARSEDVVLDMAAVLAAKVKASADGRAYEKDLLDAGFSRAEIARHGDAARAAAAETLKPVRRDEERIAAMARALADKPLSGSDRVNIATLAAAGFALKAINADLDAAVDASIELRKVAA